MASKFILSIVIFLFIVGFQYALNNREKRKAIERKRIKNDG